MQVVLAELAPQLPLEQVARCHYLMLATTRSRPLPLAQRIASSY